MKVTEEDLVGKLTGFPIEVVEKMVKYQIDAGNPADVKVFQRDTNAATVAGGFCWDETDEGYDFWTNVIGKKYFDLFFEKYPKLTDKVYIKQDGTIDYAVIVDTLENLGAINKLVHAPKTVGDVYYIDPKTKEIVVCHDGELNYNLVTSLYKQIKPNKIKVSKSKALECISFLSGIDPNLIEIVED